MQNQIDYLLATACPAIRYRVKKEILKALPPEDPLELKQAILEDALVRSYLSRVGPDGWIDADFHSESGVETAVRVLTEKGLDTGDPVIAGMLGQLAAKADTFDQGSLQRVGKILDRLDLGGSKLIGAAVFAYAGVEDIGLVREQIQRALGVFDYVIGVESIDDIAVTHRNKLVFKPGVRWPSIYHLRLLALTHGWRTEENEGMLIEAVKRLVALSPIPEINGLYRSQHVSPGSFGMHHFAVDLADLDPKGWMIWLHRMELLARAGVISSIPELKAQLSQLLQMLDERSGLFAKPHHHRYFRKWGAYTGLALEGDWRKKARYLCDVLFRSLLIVHYAGGSGTLARRADSLVAPGTRR